jgi:hypothetical protein
LGIADLLAIESVGLNALNRQLIPNCGLRIANCGFIGDWIRRVERFESSINPQLRIEDCGLRFIGD